MNPDTLDQLCRDAFEQYGAMGRDAFAARFAGKPIPGISHLCVEFPDDESYAACAAAAGEWGAVSVRPYKGRDITWCRLNTPFIHAGQTLRWLELLQPANEPHATGGVTALVYADAAMERVEKLPAPDGSGVKFRYQKFSADILAR